MKMKYTNLIVILLMGCTSILGQQASVVYPLTSATTTSVNVTGNLSGSYEAFENMTINNYSGPNSSQRITTLNGSWSGETGQNDARYIQFAVTPLTGNNFNITSIAMSIGAAGGGNMRANIRYSTDSSFASSVLLNATPLVLPSGAFLSPSPNYQLNYSVYDGEVFYLRVYPWYTSASTGKYVCLQDVNISGTTVGAALINVSGNSLQSFGAVVVGTNSSSAQYSVSGSNLSGNIIINAPANFEISSNNSTFTNSLELQNNGGTLSPTNIYCRFIPTTAIGTVTGTITHTSLNAGPKGVSVEGIGIAVEPNAQSTITFGTITGNSIGVDFTGGNGTNRILVIKKDSQVDWLPSDGVIINGVSNNFLNAVNQSNGNKVVYDGNGNSVNVVGLSSNVTYHFAVYEYNVGTNNSQNYLTSSFGTGTQTTLAVPTITVNPDNLSFGNVGVGITSIEIMYSLSAATLSPASGNIVITAPNGYQVSLTSGIGFTNQISIPYSNNSLSTIIVYVRFTPSAIIDYNGVITNSGGSAETQNIEVSGSGMVPNSQQNVDIIVAQDGTGDFTSIQEAINSIPANNTVMKVILIKKGTYNEKIFITNSNITLVGEDRENTKIIYAELRSNWHITSGGSDWGAATLNINSGVSNLVLANLTIYNNYGSLFGSNDHQFAIRGATADKIIIINCDIKADGGDTLSLWNVSSGKYYHNNCYFEGYVDFVCPRGWCYISDSRFYQRSSSASASIWHDGSANQNSKFVIRNSRFEGVPNFALGRHHLDAQFYLVDNTFSFNMKNQPIFHAVSNPPVTLQWGQRYYFQNNHRDSLEYSWYADNLDSAIGSPTSEQITAEWTFSTAPTTWNPEANFPVVLPNAEFPSPRRNELGVNINGVTLKWISGRRAVSHIVYFGTTNPPQFIGNQNLNVYNTGILQDSTTYYWCIDAVTPYDTIRGEVWSFSTSPDNYVPVEFSSFNGEMNNGKVKLSWSTQSEKNNNGFEIEKRVGNENWKSIGFIKGMGTTTEISRYSFIDESKDNSNKSVFYRLKQIDFDGSYHYSKEIEINFGKPGSFQLYQNYPNPFNPETNIKYEIMNNQFVTLKIYDSLGQEVITLINEEHEAGYYNKQFSTSGINASSGIYYYQLRAGDYINTKKMTLIK
jgi:pectinesterase